MCLVGALVATLAALGSAANTQNDPKCACIGSNGQTEANDGVMTTKQFTLKGVAQTVKYAVDYGESCKAHLEPGDESCSSSSKPAWCDSPWCYVDPCTCDGPTDMGESDYFSSTQSGERLFYSYKACGSTDQYNSVKCPALAEAACTADDECTWASSACSVSTTRVTTTRDAANCNSRSFGIYGSACRCIGNNLQERFDANGVPKVATTKAGFIHNYPADYGQSCKEHAEPGSADCTASSPAAWCSDHWCYVDPCQCVVDTSIGESDYFTSTATGGKLFYSYGACGSAATYSSSKCSAITVEANCTSEDECTWSAGACAVNNAAVVLQRTAAQCAPLTGNTACACRGTNDQTKVTSGSTTVVKTTKTGFIHDYPETYGEQCSAHGEPGASSCLGNYPAAWCTSPWCYVNPCSCDDVAIGLSDYFTTTLSGLPLYYSYKSCGATDSYNSDKCVAITAEADCTAEDECKWESAACATKGDNLATAMTAAACASPMNKPSASDAVVSATLSAGSVGAVLASAFSMQ